MANTFELLGAVTVTSGGSSTIDFSSIPATYTDLLIKLSSRNGTNANWGYVNFNDDSGSNYKYTYTIGDGSNTSCSSATTTAVILYGVPDNTYTASVFGAADIYVFNYASSQRKPIKIDGVTENNATASIVSMVAGVWTGTSAITKISLAPYSGSFPQYSTAKLYGIKNS